MKTESEDPLDLIFFILAGIGSALIMAAIWAFFISWIFGYGFWYVMKITSAIFISFALIIDAVNILGKRREKNMPKDDEEVRDLLEELDLAEIDNIGSGPSFVKFFDGFDEEYLRKTVVGLTMTQHKLQNLLDRAASEKNADAAKMLIEELRVNRKSLDNAVNALARIDDDNE